MKVDPCLNHVLTWMNVWERRENRLGNLHSEFTSCWSLLGDFEGDTALSCFKENTSVSLLKRNNNKVYNLNWRVAN